MNEKLSTYTGPMRVPFLVLAPACAVLGIASAYFSGAEVEWYAVVLIIAGAICAHIGVNAYNEYHDFKSQLDAKTERTPFSGGSGTLQKHPGLARYTAVMATVALLTASGIGIYFVIASSILIFPFGIIGAAIVSLYTSFIVKRPFLCLVAPGIGFGPCMVIGAHIAVSGGISWIALLVSAVPFFLVSNLLLLNQFPDIDADKSVGRNNLPILAGSRVSAGVFCTFLLLTYLAVILGAVLSVIPTLTLIGLATIPFAFIAGRSAIVFDGTREKLLPGLGMNVVTVIFTPILVSIGLFLG